MITPEEFASIEVGDTVTVRREVTGLTASGPVTDSAELEFWIARSVVVMMRNPEWTLVEHSKPTPAWHRAKVIAATYECDECGIVRDAWRQKDGHFNAAYGHVVVPGNFERLSDVRVLVGEDEEL